MDSRIIADAAAAMAKMAADGNMPDLGQQLLQVGYNRGSTYSLKAVPLNNIAMNGPDSFHCTVTARHNGILYTGFLQFDRALFNNLLEKLSVHDKGRVADVLNSKWQACSCFIEDTTLVDIEIEIGEVVESEYITYTPLILQAVL